MTDPNEEFKVRLNGESVVRILLAKKAQARAEDNSVVPYKESIRKRRYIDEIIPVTPQATEFVWKDIHPETIGITYTVLSGPFAGDQWATYLPLFTNDQASVVADAYIYSYLGSSGRFHGIFQFENGSITGVPGMNTIPVAGIITLPNIGGYNNAKVAAQHGRFSSNSSPYAGVRAGKYIVGGTPVLLGMYPSTQIAPVGHPRYAVQDQRVNTTTDINESGTIVGYSRSTWKFGSALKWRPGEFDPVIVFPEEANAASKAFGINNDGVIVGQTGYAGFFEDALVEVFGNACIFETDGSTTYLFDLEGNNGTGALTSCRRINNNGHILGTTRLDDWTEFIPDGWFYYDTEDVYRIDVPVDWPHDPTYIVMNNINDQNKVIGTVFYEDEYVPDGYNREIFPSSTAVLWDNEDGMIDMNTLLPEDTNIYLTEGIDISNTGVYLCKGFYTDQATPNPRNADRGFIGVPPGV